MAPAQTVLALSSTPLPSLDSVSLLPFSLAHDGPAPLSTYFLPRAYPAGPDAPPQHRQATFRGRRIVSSRLDLPQGYRGLVFSTSAPLPPSTTAEAEGGGDSQERDERAAKRAKRAAAAAAALDARLKNDDDEEEVVDDGRRRSPRKGTAASSAAARARARAVQAAKDKAKGKGKGKAGGNSGVKKGGFSLDSDEEEVVGAAVEEQVVGEVVEVEMQQEQTVVADGGVAETASAAVVAVEDTSAAAPSADPAVSVVESVEAVVVAPPPAPLRTASTLSTASSSAALLASTPLTSHASSLDLSANPFDDATSPGELARDEKRLVPRATFRSIEVWNPDWPVAGGKVGEVDDVGRTVSEWMHVAAKVRLVSTRVFSGDVAGLTHRLSRLQIHAY
ncbi:hypothetical protein Rhopal_007594-T1 [Rhodotorula paludigena]|uniref:Uncharacterized protein n=1 Tax=Rhodotorula paludigena TaxID=86838 RepID=A0AAV5GYS4_9BASI|nr:hypothetical protein Rhopal_007594-T1 [Rhodotorula paludigena]